MREQPAPADPLSPDAPASEERRGLSARHLQFRAGEHDVEIRVKADGFHRTASIMGIVRDPRGQAIPPGRLQAWLLSPGHEIAGLPVTPRGLFMARQVEGGRQILEIVIDCEECHRLCFWV